MSSCTGIASGGGGGAASAAGADDEDSRVFAWLGGNDGCRVSVTKKEAQLAITLVDMLDGMDDIDEDDDESKPTFSVDVDREVIDLLLEYLRTHDKETAHVVEELEYHDDMVRSGVPKDDAEFISVERIGRKNLFGLALIANTLNIKSLFTLACAEIGRHVKAYGDSVVEALEYTYAEQIDFTDEEHEVLMKYSKTYRDNPNRRGQSVINPDKYVPAASAAAAATTAAVASTGGGSDD
jgi:hypothetical protein